MDLLFEGVNNEGETVSMLFNRGLEMTSQQTADHIADMGNCSIYHWSRI